MDFKQTLFEKEEFERVISFLSYEICQDANNIKNLALVGIKTRGVNLAKMLSKKIKEQTKKTVKVCVIDICSFRDDDKRVANAGEGCDVCDLTGKEVILIDDVIYTGRTMRAGLCGVLHFGRPQSVKVCVLVNRTGFLQMPIFTKFVGKSVLTEQDDVVSVNVEEIDGENSVKIYSY